MVTRAVQVDPNRWNCSTENGNSSHGKTTKQASEALSKLQRLSLRQVTRGRQHWFGHTDDPDSRQKYAEFISRLQRGDMASEATKPIGKHGIFTVSELCLRFLTQHATRYKTAEGKSSAEIDCFKSAIRHLRTLFGELPANDFGPLRLIAVRQSMIDEGWSRNWVNKQIGRIRLIFRIGVMWEMVSETVANALKLVPSLTPGESSASETEPRVAVPDDDLIKVRSVLQERHQDVFDLVLMTGARPDGI